MPELDLGNVKGPQGKSAYQSALDAGYSGSEEAFNTAMAKAPDAVLYTPQSLSDAQKEQARTNINVAQGGYGYGESFSRIGHDNITDAEFVEMMEAKLSTMGYNTAAQVIWEDHPLVDGTIRVGTLWKSENGDYALLTGDGYVSTSVTRVKVNGVWQPFEWVNPPMNLGVEYRITERYLGKPVYVKVVDCGACPADGYKDVIYGTTGIVLPIRCEGTWSYQNRSTIPFESTNEDQLHIGALGGAIRIKTGGKDFSSYTCIATVWYTKSTD